MNHTLSHLSALVAIAGLAACSRPASTTDTTVLAEPHEQELIDQRTVELSDRITEFENKANPSTAGLRPLCVMEVSGGRGPNLLLVDVDEDQVVRRILFANGGFRIIGACQPLRDSFGTCVDIKGTAWVFFPPMC